MSKNVSLVDQTARDSIVAQLEVNMLVEAGAGAGKTGSTARRVAAMVASGACRIEEIAAVTYTRKAAAELVGRCRIELERGLATETGARAERLRQGLADMERMFAGTIHAFCAQLLRERPVEAGIAPEFTELDESVDDSRRRQALREFLERMRLAKSPVLAELEAAQVRPQDLDGAFATLCLYPDVDFPAGSTAAPDTMAAWVALDGFAAALKALLPVAIGAETTCGIQQQAREFLPALNWADRGRAAILAQMLTRWEKNYKSTQKWWTSKAVALQADELVRQFQAATVVPFLGQWRRYLYRLIVTVGVEARESAAESRRRGAELNYDDLLQRTATVLRTNSEVRASLQHKYARLFVDEFQDTDPIQTEIVFLLAAEPGTESDWTKVSLRRGALFLVGDPKQSIFRFRRADIDIYERAKQRIRETGGQVVELTTCFRAIPALSDWANTAFASLFPQQASAQQPAYHKLVGVNEASGAGGVFQLCLPASLERKDVPVADAQAIASYIAAEVDSGRRSWRDFLILTRKKGHLATYARELERAGVKYEVTGSEAFQDSPSVEALSSLLYSLANADDAPALVGVLRGPLFGFDDEDLFAYQRAGGRFLLNAPVNRDAGKSVADVLSSLQEMHGWSRTLPIGAAVERILERTGLLAKSSAESRGGGEAGKVLFALDCLRAANQSGASFSAAVAELEARLGAGETDAPALEPGRQDVVRLMNLHKAKGLEAKVVFLADPLAGVKLWAGVHIVRQGNSATGYFQITRPTSEFSSEVLAEPEGWPTYESSELAYVSAEELRLVYVACTRPMEMLVVSRWDKSDRYGVRPWENLAPFLANVPALQLPRAPAVPTAVTPPAITDMDRQAASALRATLICTILAPTSSVEAVTATIPNGTHEVSVKAGEPYGPAWGTIVHALLERAASDPACTKGALESCAAFHVMAEPAAEPFQAQAVEAVVRVMASPFWAHVCAARVRLAEVPIMVRIAGSSPEKLETGVIDLMLQFGDNWEIVDFKTEAADLEELAAQHGQQVRTYAAHWEQITSERVAYAGIYSVRENSLTADVRLS